ncbi:MAG: hypothetical protein KAG66_15310, partial [Methylococcales bacterium]|nr:hypothetical protein [Methylococcales bacterium]
MSYNNLTITKDGSFGGSIAVAATTSTKDLIVTNNATVAKDLTVSDNTNVAKLGVSGIIKATSSVKVVGELSIASNTTTTLGTVVTDGLTASSVTTTGHVSANTLATTGVTTFDGLSAGTTSLGASNKTLTTGNMRVKTATVSGKMTTTGELRVSDGLDVAGATTLTKLAAGTSKVDKLTVTGDMVVVGPLVGKGDTQFGALETKSTELTTLETATTGGDIKVTGLTTVGGKLTATGAADLTGTLDVVGDVNLTGATSITTATLGTAKITGALTVNNDCKIDGDLVTTAAIKLKDVEFEKHIMLDVGVLGTSAAATAATGSPWLTHVPHANTSVPTNGQELNAKWLRNGVIRRDAGSAAVMTWRMPTAASINESMTPKLTAREMFRFMVINDSAGVTHLDIDGVAGIAMVGGTTNSLTVPPKATSEFMIYCVDEDNFNIIPVSVATASSGVNKDTAMSAMDVNVTGGLSSGWDHQTPVGTTDTSLPTRLVSPTGPLPEITSSMSAAALRFGYLIKSSVGVTTVTLPTGAVLDAAIVPTITTTGAMITARIVNASSESITLVSPDSTMTIVGKAPVSPGTVGTLMVYRIAANKFKCYMSASIVHVTGGVIYPSSMTVTTDMTVGGSVIVGGREIGADLAGRAVIPPAGAPAVISVDTFLGTRMYVCPKHSAAADVVMPNKADLIAKLHDGASRDLTIVSTVMNTFVFKSDWVTIPVAAGETVRLWYVRKGDDIVPNVRRKPNVVSDMYVVGSASATVPIAPGYTIPDGVTTINLPSVATLKQNLPIGGIHEITIIGGTEECSVVGGLGVTFTRVNASTDTVGINQTVIYGIRRESDLVFKIDTISIYIPPYTGTTHIAGRDVNIGGSGLSWTIPTTLSSFKPSRLIDLPSTLAGLTLGAHDNLSIPLTTWATGIA